MNLLLSTPALNVFEHMALDEEMVFARPAETTFRFYRWTEGPAATFGYAQIYKEVEQAAPQGQFPGGKTRRPTGGGLVFHRDDLTFSLIFCSRQKPLEIYKTFHGMVFNELLKIGQKGQVFTESLPACSYMPSVGNCASACFVRPVENDLLAEDGQKILGGAIRRFGETVLYQGSLQLPAARENALYKHALISAVRNFMATDLIPQRVEASWLAASRKRAKELYQTVAWLEKF